MSQDQHSKAAASCRTSKERCILASRAAALECGASTPLLFALRVCARAYDALYRTFQLTLHGGRSQRGFSTILENLNSAACPKIYEGSTSLATVRIDSMPAVIVWDSFSEILQVLWVLALQMRGLSHPGRSGHKIWLPNSRVPALAKT